MIQEIEIDNIQIRLFDENQVIVPHKIENTPHFKALKGESSYYDLYYDRMHNFGRAKNNYMTTIQFLEFYPKFKYLTPPYENNYIQVKKMGDRYESLDGDHRLSCLKKQGYEKVYVNISDWNFKHQGFSDIINITKCLENLDDYIIIKGHEYFPHYYDNDDLDILCKNKDNFSDILQNRLSFQYPNHNLNKKNKEVRIHLDLTPPGFNRLNFRFDLLGEFPYMLNLGHNHNKIEVDKEYFNLVFNRKVSKLIETPSAFSNEKINVWFPQETDDLVFRFLEWVWQPHKTRHIQDFMKNLKNENEVIKIINKYTSIQINNQYIQSLSQDLKNKGLI